MTNTGDLTSQVILEYQSGKSIIEVAKLFPMTRHVVYSRLKKANVPLRDRIPKIVTGPAKIGEIRGSKSLGKEHRGRYIYVACPECAKTHWIRLAKYKLGRNLHCTDCSGIAIGRSLKGRSISPETRARISAKMKGSLNHRYLGKEKSPEDSPRDIKLPSDHKYFSMAHSNGFVLEHRLVMAKHIGRPLARQEVVHHKNRNRRDNRVENLVLLGSQSEHAKLHGEEDYSHEMP